MGNEAGSVEETLCFSAGVEQKLRLSFGAIVSVVDAGGIYHLETNLIEDGGVAGGQQIGLVARPNRGVLGLGGVRSFMVTEVSAGKFDLLDGVGLEVGSGENEREQRVGRANSLWYLNKASLGRLSTSTDLLRLLHEVGHVKTLRNGRSLEQMLSTASELSGASDRWQVGSVYDRDAVFILRDVIASLYALRRISGLKEDGVDLFPGDLDTNGVLSYLRTGVASYANAWGKHIPGECLKRLVDLRVVGV